MILKKPKSIKLLGVTETNIPSGIQRLEYYYDERYSQSILKEYRRNPLFTELNLLQEITLNILGEIENVHLMSHLASDFVVDNIDLHIENLQGRLMHQEDYQNQSFINTHSYYFYPRFKLIRRQIFTKNIYDTTVFSSNYDQSIGLIQNFDLPFDVFTEIYRKV